MAEPGYVYVLFNPALNGLVKIGRSKGNPNDRAAELSSATGVPSRFEVVFDAYFADADGVERYLHDTLAQKGLRFNPNREFFQMTVSDAVKAVVAAQSLFPTADPVAENGLEKGPLANLDELCDVADGLWDGDGDALQDSERAIKLYRTAISGGSQRALLSLARHWLVDENAVQWQELRRPLEQAMDMGGIEASGYLAIGMIRSNQAENANKCWERLCSRIRELEDTVAATWAFRYAVLMPIPNVKCEHVCAFRPYRHLAFRGVSDGSNQLRLELALFPEIEHQEALGKIEKTTKSEILIMADGESLYGSRRDAKLGWTFEVGDDVCFVADESVMPPAHWQFTRGATWINEPSFQHGSALGYILSERLTLDISRQPSPDRRMTPATPPCNRSH